MKTPGSNTEQNTPLFPFLQSSLQALQCYSAEDANTCIASHLQERVKELRCLYGVLKAINEHGTNIPKMMLAIASLLPPSWQYPEICCGRIILDEKIYATENYTQTAITQLAAIMIDNKESGSVEVCYTEEKPMCYEGPFLYEERLLINAVADHIGKAIKRIRTEHQLEVEKTTLKNMNVALRTVLDRVQEDRNEIATRIQKNVDEIIMPIVYEIEQQENKHTDKGYAYLLRSNLEEIISPFVKNISHTISTLSPTEVQICNMIRKGFLTKDIARLRHISPATVSRHRERIRKKLKIANKKINLRTYLDSITHQFDCQDNFKDTQFNSPRSL